MASALLGYPATEVRDRPKFRTLETIQRQLTAEEMRGALLLENPETGFAEVMQRGRLRVTLDGEDVTCRTMNCSAAEGWVDLIRLPIKVVDCKAIIHRVRGRVELTYDFQQAVAS
jgi:hypothetical protein